MFAAVATIVAVNATSASAQAAAPKWEGTFKGAWTSDGPSGTGTLTIAKDGANLKVTHLLEGDQVPPPSGDPRDWKTEGNAFSFAQTYGEFEVMFKGTVDLGAKGRWFRVLVGDFGNRELINARHAANRLPGRQLLAHEKRQDKVVRSQLRFPDEIPHAFAPAQSSRSLD